ncbi:TrbC/VirB2 family protein [Qipengyuania marisflavi]|uniref:TrbC/VirB2 family protein n=1 Tax=Qipengyuania marisflavi TaxID=2486356 RepID=A0A5S3P177_9SPHN|nr:TrbC/VirB2 family protein [Qipengyuania marisflavi]TMM46660.1 TrbC/VirB2 family protein [Qipengyuania marisflavi]
MSGPVPFPTFSNGPLEGAAGWLTGTMLGSLAIGLCVIAVATVGLLMLEGRLPLRRGARVILGCFILLGAPIIAASFTGAFRSEPLPPGPAYSALPAADPRGNLPAADYDPYAGASLRRD